MLTLNVRCWPVSDQWDVQVLMTCSRVSNRPVRDTRQV